MHNLLQLDYYENMDSEFESISIEGLQILKETYESCTKFRKKFYDKNYTFTFPIEVMKECSCSRGKIEKYRFFFKIIIIIGKK